MANMLEYLLLFPVLVSITFAYNVTFYVGDACLDEAPLGTFIGGKGQGCQQDFAGVAQGAFVSSTGPIDDNTLVQFYSTDDCSSGSETSMTSAFCAAINGPGIGNYGSFQIVDDIVTPGLQPSVTVDDPVFAAETSASSSQTSVIKRSLWTHGHSYMGRSTGSYNESDSDVSLKNHNQVQDSITQDPPSYVQPNMYHGKYSEVSGIAYRWHQVYDSGFIGVPASEWDPEKHKMDLRSLEEVTADSDPEYRPTPSVSPNYPPYNALEERAFDFSRCEFEDVCGAAFVKALNIAIMAAPMVNTAKTFANKAGKTLWEFLNTPFVSAFTAQALADKLGSQEPLGVTTVIQITGPSPSTIANCSATSLDGLSIPQINDQIASVINSMVTTTVISAQTVAIAWSGTVVVSPVPGKKARRQYSTENSFRLAMDVVSCGSDFSGQLCGLTTGLCEF